MSSLLSALALLAPALAADPAILNANADVEAVKRVTMSPDELYPRLLDLHNLEAALDCTRKWQYGETTRGVGANATLVYKVGPWRRKLAMTLAKAEENKRVTFDHAGDKGFVTTWTLEPDGEGTKVDVHTYLNLPPWPVRKYYLRRIQPDWAACQERAIERMAKEIGGS